MVTSNLHYLRCEVLWIRDSSLSPQPDADQRRNEGSPHLKKPKYLKRWALYSVLEDIIGPAILELKS